MSTPATRHTTYLPDNGASRRAIIRRVYVYVVAFISYTIAFVTINNLIGLLIEAWFVLPAGAAVLPDRVAGDLDYIRQSVARDAGLLLVAVPLFLLHWWYANHRLTEIPERRSALRKAYLYAALVVAGLFAYGSLYELVRSLLLTTLPTFVDATAVGQGDISLWIHKLTIALLGMLMLWYWQRILWADGDYGREEFAAAGVRRLFQTGVGLVGVVLIIFSGSAILSVALDWPATRSTLQAGSVAALQFSDGFAGLLIGLLLLHRVEAGWREIIEMNPLEGRSGIRRLFLFAATMIAAIATITPLILILRQILLLLFGTGEGDRLALYLDLVEPLAFLLVGGTMFLAMRRRISHDIDAYGDSRASISAQRIYRYLATAIGLALGWIGSIELLQALIDALFGRGEADVAGVLWVEPLATGLSLLVVGLPIWVIHWRPLRAAARVDDPSAKEERESLPRRLYLYGAALVSALLALVSLAQVLYRVFLFLLGDPDAGIWTSEMASEVAWGAVALAIWLFHIKTIREDGALNRAAEIAETDEAHAEDGNLRHEVVRVEQDIEQLEAELAAARRRLSQLQGLAAPSAKEQ